MASRSKTNKRSSPARKDSLIRRFETEVGKADLRGMMDYSGDPRAYRLLEMLLDPAYRNHSLAKLCEKVGLRMADLLDIFRRFKWDVGMIDVYKQLPQIAKDLVTDAKSSEVPCKRCDGERKLNIGKPEERSCPQCKGTGTVSVPGDAQARRLVMEIVGLTGRNRPPEVKEMTSDPVPRS